MLRQCERSVQPYDVATASPLGDSTSVELMESITMTERVKAQLEEDISMKVDAFGPEGDVVEQEDRYCVESRKHTMGSPEASSRGKTASGGSSTYYNNQQEKQGLGLMRLLQFSSTLSNESPQKHHLSYWNDLIREYFTPRAIMRLTLWKDNQRIEAKPFEIGVLILPRFFLVTTQSGVKSMTLSLDSAQERMYQRHTIVECPGASWTHRYRNGYTVTLRGPLTAHVIATSRSPPGSNTVDFMYKFDEFQFDANLHDKHIAIESILGVRSIENLGIGPAGQSRSDDESQWEEPRVLIDYASLPGEPVNAFGIPQASMRCLELAESITSMAELIQLAKESSHDPLDALKEFAIRLRESGAVLPPQPPTQPPLPGHPMNINPPFYQDQTRKQTGTARKRAKMPSTNSSATNGKKNLSLLPTMPLDILFEILCHLSPRDILSVSRASKIFHATFMNRSARTVWKAARDRFDAPECPSWMSEPAWAALLFGHICQSCGTSNVHKVDFLLLKRVCASCKKTHLLIRSKAASRYPGILDFVPSTNVSVWYHGHAGNNNYYWDTDLERMVEGLLKLEEDVKKDLPNSQKMLLDFKEEHKQRVTQIQQASPQWQAWYRAVQLERVREKREAQNRRIEQIKEKFRELGYTDEDVPNNQKEFCSTAPLTEKSWKRIRSMLEPQAIVRKADRLLREASMIRCNRRHIIHSRYVDFQRTLHPSQWKYLPQTWEIIGFEPLARHVEAPVEVEVISATFDDAFTCLPELLTSAMEERKESLRDLLPNGLNGAEKFATSHDPMDLATASFRCKEDSALLFGWDEIASHHCQEQGGSLWDYDADLQPQTTAPPFEYSPFAGNVVKKVAEIIGLDCATITPAELDKENLRFSCDSCESYREGVNYYETGYDWRTLADHLHMSLEDSHNLDLRITVLSSKDAVKVQQCERDEKWRATQWTCTHCPEHLDNLQTHQDVLQHLHDSHAIVTPSEPTDLLFFERHRKAWINPPRFTVYKTVEPTPLFRCLLCPRNNTSSSYILPNIEDHLKKIHQVVDAEIEVNYAAIRYPVLTQPLFSVRTVRY